MPFSIHIPGKKPGSGVHIGSVSQVNGQINIQGGRGGGSGSVHIGNISQADGGQINIGGGNITQDNRGKKKKGKKQKKGWW